MRTEAQRRSHENYYARHRDRAKKRSADWRDENREAYLEDQRRRTKERKERNPELERRRARGYALKRKYGITLEQYEELLEQQNSCCAVCERHQSEFKTNLAVDHDHASGRIRGLLCTNCNYRMVAKHKDGDLLRKIADYIEQGTEWFVPDDMKTGRKKRRKKKVKTIDS